MSTLDNLEPSLAPPTHPPTGPDPVLLSNPAATRRPTEPIAVYRLKRKLILPREEGNVLPTGRRARMPVYRGLPDRCICCGKPVDEADASIGGRRIKRRMTWHNSAVYLILLLCFFGLLPGLVLYAIVAACCSEKALVWLPLCRGHLLRRRVAQWVTYGLFGSTIVLAVVAAAFQSRVLLAGMGAGFLLSIIWAIPGAHMILLVRAERIDYRGVVLHGASKKFLNTLPERKRGESELIPPRQPPLSEAA